MTDAEFHAENCSACQKGLPCKTADIIAGRTSG